VTDKNDMQVGDRQVRRQACERVTEKRVTDRYSVTDKWVNDMTNK